MIYPNCSPEFQIVLKANGTEELQVRYINITQCYTSKWQAVPKIIEVNNEVK